MWICLPLLAWVAVWVAALAMPTADCGGSETDAGAEEAVLVIIVAASSLGAAGAALLRLRRLGRAGAFSLRRDLAIGGVAALVLAAAGAASAAHGGAVQALAVVGLLLTGVALLGLLGAWAAGLSVDDVGLLLPLYLLGAAVLAYPLVGLLGVISSSGIGC